MKPFSFIFYKFYKFALKSEKQWNANVRMPHLVAFFSLSIVQFINIFTIIIIASHGFNLFTLSKLNPSFAVLSMSLIFLMNYFSYIKKRKYIKIANYHNKKYKKKNTLLIDILFWVYIISSFPLLILALELLVSK